jgi:hypothetical protein
MPGSLFKYMSADLAKIVLDKRTLRWSAPERFNDPFEFKSPFELGFEWEDLETPFFDEFSRVVTQNPRPALADPAENIAVLGVMAARYVCKGMIAPAVVAKYRPGYPKMLESWKEGAEKDRQAWDEMKRRYRVLCFSAVPDNILMWSHYAQDHQGAVLGFQPKLELDTPLLAARSVFYSREVPNGGSLAQFVKYVTGQWPEPSHEGAFDKATFTKSLSWAYENEWRILDKEPAAGPTPYSDRAFEPRELVTIYFGCRASDSSKVDIIAAAKSLGTPISFFEMRDGRIRFELTPEPLTV